MTIETTRMISDEITNQVTRRLNEIKSSLNTHVQDAISSAIVEKVLPSIQNTLDAPGRANFTMMDQRSCELHRSPEARNSQKAWEICPKTGFTLKNKRHTSRESSVDSLTSGQNCDILHAISFQSQFSSSQHTALHCLKFVAN